jgi:hypothetical protein
MVITGGGNVGIGTTSPTGSPGNLGSLSADKLLDVHKDGWVAGEDVQLRVGDVVVNSRNEGSSEISTLTARGGTGNLNIGASGLIWFSTGGNNERMRIDALGNVTGTYGNYHVSSDIRRKKDIVTIPNALDKVLALRGVNFRWKDSEPDDNLHMGMIAQEVEKVVPEIVHTANDKMRTKAVEYQYMVGLLVEAIKEQQKGIDELKEKVKLLEAKLNAGQ